MSPSVLQFHPAQSPSCVSTLLVTCKCATIFIRTNLTWNPEMGGFSRLQVSLNVQTSGAKVYVAWVGMSLATILENDWNHLSFFFPFCLNFTNFPCGIKYFSLVPFFRVKMLKMWISFFIWSICYAIKTLKQSLHLDDLLPNMQISQSRVR